MTGIKIAIFEPWPQKGPRGALDTRIAFIRGSINREVSRNVSKF